MIKTTILALPIAAALAGFSVPAMSEPTSPPAKIISVRPYIGSTDIYFTIDSNAICDTNVFKIDMRKPTAQQTYAALLLAMANNMKTKVEVANATGCVGWGTEIQSISIAAE